MTDAISGVLDMVCTVGEKVLQMTERDPAVNSHDLPPIPGTKEFLKRSAESQRICAKYPDRIPVIIITHGGLVIDKPKFLVPADLTWGQLMYTVRKRLTMTPGNHLSSEESLYGMTKNTMVCTGTLVSVVAKTATYSDGMMYVHIYKENTFG